MKTVWVLMCLELCNPTDALRKTWDSKEDCRTEVINVMNKWKSSYRFYWKCVEAPANRGTKYFIPSAEDLEQKD